MRYTLIAIAAAATASLGLTVSAWGQDGHGEDDAIRAALQLAAEDAVTQMVVSLPPEIETIAVLPFARDADGAAVRAIEHELIQRASQLGVRVVTRSDPDWMRLTSEWEFTEDMFDVIPEELLPEFQNVLPAGAVVWGVLEYAGLDDSRIKGQARIQTRMGAVATGHLVGSGSAEAVVQIDPETFFLALAHEWWAWVIVGVVVVGLLLLLFIAPWALRLMAQGSKPRTVIRKS
ncbi:MAG: hypothetical protein KAS72_05445 [Phycisphaerales bacterium]|nr:hypothetical protein [Phycisphaerales bacterium]